MDWLEKLTPFGFTLASRIASRHDFTASSRYTNIITEEVARIGGEAFYNRYKDIDGYSNIAVSVAAFMFQARFHDFTQGPDGDGRRKTGRRQWYSWFKKFAQDLDFEMSPNNPKFGIKWAGMMSRAMARIVDRYGATYHDLWVSDTSRMQAAMDIELFKGANILIAVEKDSLFEDATRIAKALGAKGVISGKGKNSKAATERILMDIFLYNDPWSETLVDEDNPLIILVLSDYDYDGEAVIQHVFTQQALRYTPHVIEARIGAKPESVSARGYDLLDVSYIAKVKRSSGYEDWANVKGMYKATCSFCDKEFMGVGIDYHTCPNCGTKTDRIPVLHEDYTFGLEVECMTTADYYLLALDALFEVMSFTRIVNGLRDDCTADPYDVGLSTSQAALAENKTYKQLLSQLEEYEKLKQLKDYIDEQALSALWQSAEPEVARFRDDDDDPEPHEFRDHVEGCASGYPAAWRPFRVADRNERLVEWMIENDPDGKFAQFKAADVWQVGRELGLIE